MKTNTTAQIKKIKKMVWFLSGKSVGKSLLLVHIVAYLLLRKLKLTVVDGDHETNQTSNFFLDCSCIPVTDPQGFATLIQQVMAEPEMDLYMIDTPAAHTSTLADLLGATFDSDRNFSQKTGIEPVFVVPTNSHEASIVQAVAYVSKFRGVVPLILALNQYPDDPLPALRSYGAWDVIEPAIADGSVRIITVPRCNESSALHRMFISGQNAFSVQGTDYGSMLPHEQVHLLAWCNLLVKQFEPVLDLILPPGHLLEDVPPDLLQADTLDRRTKTAADVRSMLKKGKQ